MFSSVGYETHFATGIWIFASIFVFRRELFCIVHQFFALMSDMKPDVWTKLPHYIVNELRAEAIGLAFAAANIRAPMATFAYATDATPTSGGAVKSPLPREIAENTLCSIKAEGVYQPSRWWGCAPRAWSRKAYTEFRNSG